MWFREWMVFENGFHQRKKNLLQHHPSLEDVLIVQENEYCQSKSITIFIGIIYAYKGVLLVSELCLMELSVKDVAKCVIE